MGRHSDYVLNQVTDVVVNASQTCITTAINEFILEIKNARRVVISNVNVESTTETAGAESNCENNLAVDQGELQRSADERMRRIMQTTSKTKGRVRDYRNVQVAVSESLTVDVTQNCIAEAINRIKIRLSDASDTITVQNVEVQQVARAVIQECLQNATVIIGEKPYPTMRDALEKAEAEGLFTTIVDGVTGGGGGGGEEDDDEQDKEAEEKKKRDDAVDGAIERELREQRAQPCTPASAETVRRLKERNAVLGAGAGALVILTLIGIMIYQLIYPVKRA